MKSQDSFERTLNQKSLKIFPFIVSMDFNMVLLHTACQVGHFGSITTTINNDGKPNLMAEIYSLGNVT